MLFETKTLWLLQASRILVNANEGLCELEQIRQNQNLEKQNVTLAD